MTKIVIEHNLFDIYKLGKVEEARPVVQYSTTDQKVVGSNTIWAKTGIHVYHNPHDEHEYRSICHP